MIKPILYIDFECYSECNIKEQGGYTYAKHPSTQIICLGYAFDDSRAEIWTPRDEFPDEIIKHVKAKGKVIAHNATFDFRIWNYIGCAEFGWPALSLDQVTDSMALCQTFQLPASLADAGSALQINLQKDKRGTVLIRLCCVPQANGQQPSIWGPKAHYFLELFEYCKRDIEAMREIVQTLPRNYLIPKEQAIWQLTYKMNTHGLPVDESAIRIIKNQVEKYVEQTLKQVPKLSNGAFSTLGQIQKIRDWCANNGYYISALDAATVAGALRDPSLPEVVRPVLKLRQELGSSSVAKYKKLDGLVYSGYVHDNMQYHGAGTGRWAGRGFQVHNLPRASIEDPETYISCFKCGDYGVDTQFVAKALIRPMIKAPDGFSLLVADYNSIENRVLHWLADDFDTLLDFSNGIDQYKAMASARYNVSLADVTKAQRQMGKVIILGCGFGMGKKKFKETAAVQFNLEISEDDSALAVSAYRERYFKIPELWNGLKIAAVRTVLSGERHSYGRITFSMAKVNGILWLAMKLPSGKCLYYMSPSVEQHFIPDFEHMGRVPTITHMGVNPYSKKWSRLKLIPGRITENAVQATAREIMAQGLLNVQQNMPQVFLLASVHDEGIGMIHNDFIDSGTRTEFEKHLCTIDWADGLPLKAESYISRRYKK